MGILEHQEIWSKAQGAVISSIFTSANNIFVCHNCWKWSSRSHLSWLLAAWWRQKLLIGIARSPWAHAITPATTSTANHPLGRKFLLMTPTNPIAGRVVPPPAVVGRHAAKPSTRNMGTHAMSFLSPVPRRVGKGPLFDALTARRMTVGTLDQ